jgi:Protein of unknown function (DUF4446)
VDGLTDAAGIAALVAGALALTALVVLVVLWRRVARLRREQRAVLGDGERDLVAHAADLEHQFKALHEWVIDVVTRVEGRLDVDEARLDGALAHRAVVRYDAYNELSGRQSTSIALLDERRSGVVLSSIHHREQARLYVKQVQAGVSAVPLSPEEQEAVRAALAGEVPDAAEGDA